MKPAGFIVHGSLHGQKGISEKEIPSKMEGRSYDDSECHGDDQQEEGPFGSKGAIHAPVNARRNRNQRASQDPKKSSREERVEPPVQHLSLLLKQNTTSVVFCKTTLENLLQ
jgi:hypothetical protein